MGDDWITHDGGKQPVDDSQLVLCEWMELDGVLCQGVGLAKDFWWPHEGNGDAGDIRRYKLMREMANA